jgi:hypothetical protein
MPYRKRKKLKGIDPNSREYWNELLARENLTMWEGLTPRLSYVGSDGKLGKIADVRDNSWTTGGGKKVRTSERPE